jgi:hypothetical protein
VVAVSVAADHRTSKGVVTAMQASPHREIEIEPCRLRLPVREVDL